MTLPGRLFGLSGRMILFTALGMAAALGVDADGKRGRDPGGVVAELPFPGEMEGVPQPFYRHRADGKPGREITLNFKAAKLEGKAQVEVAVDGRTETTELPPVAGGAASCRVLLPADVGMNRETQVGLMLRRGNRELKKSIKVPPMRYWTVFLYPHSHVDIG